MGTSSRPIIKRHIYYAWYNQFERVKIKLKLFITYYGYNKHGTTFQANNLILLHLMISNIHTLYATIAYSEPPLQTFC